MEDTYQQGSITEVVLELASIKGGTHDDDLKVVSLLGNLEEGNKHIQIGSPHVLASFPGRVGGERRPGIHCSRKRRIPRKTWEFVFVCKWSVKFIRIRPIHFRIIEKKQVRKRFLCV